MSNNSDNQALIDFVDGQYHATPRELDAGKRYAFIVRTASGVEVRTLDTEDMLGAPRRAFGTVVVHSAGGFAEAVRRLVPHPADTGVNIYADETAPRLVAVLNDDDDGAAGWRDHRVELGLRRTPEWEHWLGRQELGDQERFARTIEDGLFEIVEPAAADMLDLAQTFQASTEARFHQGGRLADGRRQFTYDENLTATAGEAGTLEIPEEFLLHVAPFYGSEPVTVRCRLRYRVREGKLTIGYNIIRPQAVELEAFRTVVAGVEADLGIVTVEGVAPPMR